MENPLHNSGVNENKAHEARENMDQELERKYEENAPNVYELNSVDIKQSEWPLHTQRNSHIIQELVPKQ